MSGTPQKRLRYRLSFETPVRRGSIEGEWKADQGEAVSLTCQIILQYLQNEHRQLLSGATDMNLKLQEAKA